MLALIHTNTDPCGILHYITLKIF